MNIEFHKPIPGGQFIASKCGRYTIDRAGPKGGPMVYLLWKREAIKGADGTRYPDIVGKFDSAADAIKFLNDLQVEQ